MAVTAFVHLPDLGEVRKDLEAIELGLGRELADVRRDAAKTVARTAKPLTPRGPGPISGAQHPDDALPHIADTLRAQVGGVGSSHPGAPVHEYGGTIAPHGSDIEIEASEMAHDAADLERGRIEGEMKRAIDRLMDRST